MPTERPPLVGRVMPTFADRGCCVVSATDPPVVSLGFLHRSCYYFFQVAPHLSSRGWVDPVPDPLLLRKSGSAGDRTQDLWICSQRRSFSYQKVFKYISRSQSYKSCFVADIIYSHVKAIFIRGLDIIAFQASCLLHKEIISHGDRGG
jgi:hypothetical protein